MTKYSYTNTCSKCGRVIYSNNVNRHNCQFCGTRRETIKTPIEKQVELAKDYLIKKQYIEQYNADHDSDTLQSADLVDLEVAKEYLAVTRQAQEPREVTNDIDNKIVELDNKINELKDIVKQLYEKFIQYTTSNNNNELLLTKAIVCDIITRTGLLSK